MKLESFLKLVSSLVEAERILLWNSYPVGAPCVYFPNETSVHTFVSETARRGARVIYVDLSDDGEESIVQKLAFPIGGILHALDLTASQVNARTPLGFRFGEFLVTAPKIDLTQYKITTESVEHESRINEIMNRIPPHLRKSAIDSVAHDSFIGYQNISRISNPLLADWSDEELSNGLDNLRGLYRELFGNKRKRKLEQLASELILAFNLDFSIDLSGKISLALGNIPDSLIDSSVKAVSDPDFKQHGDNVNLSALTEWRTSDYVQYQSQLKRLYSALIGDHLEIEAKKIASKLIQIQSWDPLFNQEDLADWVAEFAEEYQMSNVYELVIREIRIIAERSGRRNLAIDEIRSHGEKILHEMSLEERDKFASYSARNNELRLEVLRELLGSQFTQTYMTHLNSELRGLDELKYRTARDKRFAYVVTTLFDRGDTKTSISTTLGIPISKINNLLSLFPDPEGLEDGDYLQDLL